MGFFYDLFHEDEMIERINKRIDNDPTAQERIAQRMKEIEEDKIKNPMPHCPSCGSTNVRRISSGEKVASTLVFGIFSNKRKKQFQCLNPNCKYRW